MYFDLGRIRYANLETLKGKEAVYQLFLSPLQESFIFQGGPLPADFTDEEEIMESTTGLLMECVHLQDELRDLKTEFFDDQRQFKLHMQTLAWEHPDTAALACRSTNAFNRRTPSPGWSDEFPATKLQSTWCCRKCGRRE